MLSWQRNDIAEKSPYYSKTLGRHINQRINFQRSGGITDTFSTGCRTFGKQRVFRDYGGELYQQ